MDVKTRLTTRVSQRLTKTGAAALALLALCLPTHNALAVGVTKTFQYGGDSTYNVADVFYPDNWDGVSDVPSVVYFHGGGFVGGDKTGPGDGIQIGGAYLIDRLKQDLNARGVAFISADYRLVSNGFVSTTVTSPAQIPLCYPVQQTATAYGISFPYVTMTCTVAQPSASVITSYQSNGVTLQNSMQDGMTLMKYLRDNRSNMHIHPNRIIVAGSSAGAGIAQYIALQPNTADSTVLPPRAAVLAEAQTTYNPDHIFAQGPNLTTDGTGATTVAADYTLNSLTNNLLWGFRPAGVSLLNSVSPVTLGLTTATKVGAPVPVSYYNWRYSDTPCNPSTYGLNLSVVGAFASLDFGDVTSAAGAYTSCLEHNAFFPRFYAQSLGINHSVNDPSPTRANGSTGQWIEVHHVNDSTYTSGKLRSQPVPSNPTDPAYNNLYQGILGYIMWVTSWSY